VPEEEDSSSLRKTNSVPNRPAKKADGLPNCVVTPSGEGPRGRKGRVGASHVETGTYGLARRQTAASGATPNCFIHSLPGAAPGSPVDKFTMNERLQLLSGAQCPWLYRDGDPLPQDAVRLGHFAKQVLYISKAEKWELSDFTLFVLTATAQSAAATNSSGSLRSIGQGWPGRNRAPRLGDCGGQVLPLLGQ
jgi:hypothetical protein